LSSPVYSSIAQVSWVAVGVLGLITGSFLNAVIHRLPLGISLLNPRRSFCPECEKTIPWHENLPVVSWLLLRGRCSGCAMPIALRYPLVELLTSTLYLLAWGRFGLPIAPLAWILISLAIAATFIDFDHLIIPDQITLGGVGAGLLSAMIVPSLLGATSWWQGLLFSVIGASSGYFLLWGVVEGGKLAFGRKRIRPDAPMPLEIKGSYHEYSLKVGEEDVPLAEFFHRPSDRVEASCAWVEIDGERLDAGTLLFDSGGLRFSGRVWSYVEITEVMPVRAEVIELVLPREAMGFGDVKFLACIGAFLGWKGVLFTLFSGSVVGAVIGILTLAFTRGRSGGRIPFGPYLALGALLWMFYGPELLALYASWLRGYGPGISGFFLSHHPFAV